MRPACLLCSLLLAGCVDVAADEPCGPDGCGPVCGNGRVEEGEACDDADDDPLDGCHACRRDPTCGDGTCDGDDCTTCPGDCDGCLASCGNGTCERATECGACEADCAGCVPTCGNGRVEPGEACDATEEEGCGPSCRLVVTATAIDAGSQSVLALATDGSLLGLGANDYRELSPIAGPVAQPRVVEPERRFVAAAAGAFHVLATDEGGVTWAFGSNEHGELGTGSEDALPQVAAPVAGEHRFVRLAAGSMRSFGLDEQGALWAWGYNREQALGLGPSRGEVAVREPELVAPGPFVAVAIGTAHALAIDGDGAVWGWGRGALGAITGAPVSDVATPTRLDFLPAPCEAVAAGEGHSVASCGGTVFTWGSNRSGQLGRETPVQQVQPAGAVTLGGARARSVAAGYEHTLVVGEDGSLWAFGLLDGGRLCAEPAGSGAHGAPILVPVADVAEVAAGDRHTVFRRGSGAVWRCGTFEFEVGGDASPRPLELP